MHFVYYTTKCRGVASLIRAVLREIKKLSSLIILEMPGVQSVPDFLHQMIVEIQIVHDAQPQPKRFIGFQKMPDISS